MPVTTKMPAPMEAPMPRRMRSVSPNLRLRLAAALDPLLLLLLLLPKSLLRENKDGACLTRCAEDQNCDQLDPPRPRRCNGAPAIAGTPRWRKGPFRDESYHHDRSCFGKASTNIFCEVLSSRRKVFSLEV